MRVQITRLLVVVSAVLGFAAAASAATLSVLANKTTYSVGETITLSVSGDAQGATAYGVFGRLLYTGTGSVTPQTGTQKKINPAVALGVLTHGAGFSDSFNQIAGLIGATATNLPADNPFSTITLIATGLGVVDANWEVPYPTDGNGLYFFGLQSAPGTSFTIVPESSTGLLVFVGLLGLAGWRRARCL